jgi:hypothetical protein
MKIRAAFSSMLLLLSFCLLTKIQSVAQSDLYDNGPINGTIQGWSIAAGDAVDDTFTISSSTGSASINGLSFGAWLSPGDTLVSAELSITSQPLGGVTYFDQVVNFTGSDCSVNNLGYQVCRETSSFNGPTLNNGLYWLNLQNAVTSEGALAWWDANDGVGCSSPGCPSQAVENGTGTIPSESFTILGTQGSTGTTPEPASAILFASGILTMAGALRRKLM